MGEELYGEKKGYKKALVIFIDILGSQSRDDFEELYEINELFHSELLENVKQDREYLAYQRHIYTFSDCAYLIYDYRDRSEDDWGKLFNVALLNCEPLIMKFLNEGLISRGGVAFGNVYYDDNKNMFFGDAVNRAYQYESGVAKVPRIVIDDYVANQIFAFLRRKDKCIVRQDSDGRYYLNYFKSLQEGIDYSSILQKSNKEFVDDLLALCKDRILLFSNNVNICSKYEWLKKYTEESINYDIIGKVVYKKPLWDRMMNSVVNSDHAKIFKRFMYTNYVPSIDLSPETLLADCNLRMLPNVGESYDDLKQREQFEKFLNIDIIQRLMEIEDDESAE